MRRTRSLHRPVAALGVAVVIAMAPSAAFADDIQAEPDVPTNGTEQTDNITGTPGDDIIFGNGGDDDIRGGAGDDLINGGDGDDEIRGNGGDDLINGGDGNDDLRGGAGDDIIDGGAGDDVIRGGAGNDNLCGQEGDNRLIGGTGNDLACLTNDEIDGAAGDDQELNLSGNDEQLEDEDEQVFERLYQLLNIPDELTFAETSNSTGVFSYSTAASCDDRVFNFRYSLNRLDDQGIGPVEQIADVILNIAASEADEVCNPVDPGPVDPGPVDPGPVDNGDDADPVAHVDDEDDMVAAPIVAGHNANGNAVLPNAGAGDELGALVPAGLAALVAGSILVASTGRRRKSMV